MEGTTAKSEWFDAYLGAWIDFDHRLRLLRQRVECPGRPAAHDAAVAYDSGAPPRVRGSRDSDTPHRARGSRASDAPHRVRGSRAARVRRARDIASDAAAHSNFARVPRRARSSPGAQAADGSRERSVAAARG